MLKHAGKEFEVKAPEDAPAGAPIPDSRSCCVIRLPGIGFAPPIMTFPEGFTIAQTGAINVALGKACDLAPSDAAGDAKAQQLQADVVDLNTEQNADKPADRIAKWMEHFETQLGDNDYFVNNTLSYADFFMFPVTPHCFSLPTCVRLPSLPCYADLQHYSGQEGSWQVGDL